MTAWMQIAEFERALGVAEIAGKEQNPRILEYHASCNWKNNRLATKDETSWCSSFVKLGNGKIWSFWHEEPMGT